MGLLKNKRKASHEAKDPLRKLLFKSTIKNKIRNISLRISTSKSQSKMKKVANLQETQNNLLVQEAACRSLNLPRIEITSQQPLIIHNICRISIPLSKLVRARLQVDSLIDKNMFDSCPGHLSSEEIKQQRKQPSSFAFSTRKGPNHYIKIRVFYT